MRVLIQSRKNFYELRGGDTVQLLKTKAELEKLGVEADISLEYEPDLSGYDLVHLSNLTRVQETWLQMRNAVRQRRPVLLSTIYWPMDEFEKKGQVGIRRVINSRLGIDNEERVKALARWLKDRNSRHRATRNLWKVGYTRMQRDVVRHVDYFLPNSEMEMEMLCRNLHLKKENYRVIPNAVDGEAACRLRGTAVPSEFERFRGAVVCVGRIEPRKNQLALVRALDGLPYRLVLVGAVSANQKSYFEEIRRYLKRNPDFYYLPGMEQEKLYQLYRVCRVSALPSWLDTPGLVSLEAGVMGCSLAVSSKGSTTEYFGNYAEYCLPDDLDSIRRAVAAAYQKPQTTALQEKILNSYTWKIAAEKTLDSYHAVLERARAGH